MDSLEKQFDEEMRQVYGNIRAATKYPANYFLRDINTIGGLATAKKYLAKEGISTGFQKLMDAGRTDVSMEAVVLKPIYAGLFTDAEIEIARKRMFEDNKTQ